jgi:hypothetical protein
MLQRHIKIINVNKSGTRIMNNAVEAALNKDLTLNAEDIQFGVTTITLAQQTNVNLPSRHKMLNVKRKL